MRLDEIQDAVREAGLDGWLFYDHHHRDPLAYRVLDLPQDSHTTRRWYYFIPAHGEPHALVHKIESHKLDSLPGRKFSYSRWTEQADQLRSLLGSARRIAMQHSPECAIPYIAMVDGGTLELIRTLGVQVVSSADLVQLFEARWTDQQFASHIEAGKRMDRIRSDTFQFIATALRDNVDITEWDVRAHLLDSFGAHGLVTDHGPIVAVNANASDPHYEPTQDRHSPIRHKDLVLIDMWAKIDEHAGVYYDITWTGYCGTTTPAEMVNAFAIVAGARDTGIETVQRGVRDRSSLRGCDVDDAVRAYIESRGMGEYFIHRTGHSIGADVHGAGANMDNFETHDGRKIISRTCFSIEPGVYLPQFGIRSEVNMYIRDTDAIVTGEIQRELLRLG